MKTESIRKLVHGKSQGHDHPAFRVLEAELNRLVNDRMPDIMMHQHPKFHISGRMTGSTVGWFKTFDLIIAADCPYHIFVSRKLIETFGVERALGTVRHEYAHWEIAVRGRPRGHTAEFKALCAEIGGTMNAKMAGDRFSAAASTDYIVQPKKFKYECSCGVSHLTKQRLDRRKARRYHCSKCNKPMLEWTVTDLRPNGRKDVVTVAYDTDPRYRDRPIK